MITLHRSTVHPEWVELKDGSHVLDEVEIRFRFRFMHKTFSTLDEAKQFIQDTERKQAKTYACYLLSARSYASKLLARKLEEKGYSSLVAKETIEKFKSLGFLQDDQWQKQEIEREFSRGHGPRFIEAKWRAKGLPIEAVRKHLTEERQKVKVRELWDKFAKRKGDRRKVIRALVARGFDLDLIMQFCYVPDS